MKGAFLFVWKSYKIFITPNLPYGHIARKGTSPLHELFFCVGQDAPYNLPYSHIARKGTSPLHELIFYVGQDALLKLPYGFLPRNPVQY